MNISLGAIRGTLVETGNTVISQVIRELPQAENIIREIGCYLAAKRSMYAIISVVCIGMAAAYKIVSLMEQLSLCNFTNEQLSAKYSELEQAHKELKKMKDELERQKEKETQALLESTPLEDQNVEQLQTKYRRLKVGFRGIVKQLASAKKLIRLMGLNAVSPQSLEAFIKILDADLTKKEAYGVMTRGWIAIAIQQAFFWGYNVFCKAR